MRQQIRQADSEFAVNVWQPMLSADLTSHPPADGGGGIGRSGSLSSLGPAEGSTGPAEHEAAAGLAARLRLGSGGRSGRLPCHAITTYLYVDVCMCASERRRGVPVRAVQRLFPGLADALLRLGQQRVVLPAHGHLLRHPAAPGRPAALLQILLSFLSARLFLLLFCRRGGGNRTWGGRYCWHFRCRRSCDSHSGMT